MSPTLVCPHPQRCAGARTHRAGSAAARACAVSGSRAFPPAPFAPTTPTAGDDHGAALAPSATVAALAAQRQIAVAGYQNLPHDPRGYGKELAGAMASSLAEGEASGWSTGCGSPHPVGGYHERLVIVETSMVAIVHRDDQGRRHRTDGPAEITFDRTGDLDVAVWSHHGQYHRVSGPAVVFGCNSQAPARFFLNDVEAGIGPLDHGATMAAREQPFDLFVSMTVRGVTPTAAVFWLAVGHALGDHEAAAGLREGGADAALCASAAMAGVRDVNTLAQVGHGRLPPSWAMAGLAGA